LKVTKNASSNLTLVTLDFFVILIIKIKMKNKLKRNVNYDIHHSKEMMLKIKKILRKIQLKRIQELSQKLEKRRLKKQTKCKKKEDQINKEETILPYTEDWKKEKSEGDEEDSSEEIKISSNENKVEISIKATNEAKRSLKVIKHGAEDETRIVGEKMEELADCNKKQKSCIELLTFLISKREKIQEKLNTLPTNTHKNHSFPFPHTNAPLSYTKPKPIQQAHAHADSENTNGNADIKMEGEEEIVWTDVRRSKSIQNNIINEFKQKLNLDQKFYQIYDVYK
jgi:hypothetical protein